VFNLFIALFIILLISFPLAVGEQSLAVGPQFRLDVTDTECHIFLNITVGLRERAFSMNSRQPIALNNAWRLFRLRINGSFLHEELRATDHSGLFLHRPDSGSFFMFFEMLQEGAECKSRVYSPVQILFSIRPTIELMDADMLEPVLAEVSKYCISLSSANAAASVSSTTLPGRSDLLPMRTRMTSRRATLQMSLSQTLMLSKES
jgi:hypothetical protein